MNNNERVEGKVKLETYELKLTWEELEKLVQHFQKNPLGAVIKVTIGGECFDA